VASVRRQQKLPPCRTEPMVTSSKTDLFLAKLSPSTTVVVLISDRNVQSIAMLRL